jgi:hypothetical protein
MIKNLLRKNASVLSDYFGNVPSGIMAGGLSAVGGPVPFILSKGLAAAGAGGEALGAFGSAPSDEDIAEFDREEAKAFIPGVAPYRMLARARHNANKTGGAHPEANVYGETWGFGTSALASMIAGAALGALKSPSFGESLNSGSAGDARIRNAAIGAAVGGIGALGLHGIGALAAAIARRRTRQEQKAHDESMNWDNWLVPGVSAFNRYKRIGRMLDEEKA